MNSRVGKYFTIQELCRSTTATKMGISNTPSQSVVDNLIALIQNVLDPIREAWGRPIIVNSGYRSLSLNRIVGGVSNSQHLTGQAADITTGNKVDNARLFQLIQSLNLSFDQLIDEADFSWIHVSFDKNRSRKQVLKIK